MNADLVVINAKGDRLKVKDLIVNKVDVPLAELLDEKSYQTLLTFKNKEYIMNEKEKDAAFYGLLDCLLAFLCDWRVTEFESNCESHWTVTKLSATLSAFVNFEDLKEMQTSFCRRSLIFPVVRNFDLSLKVIEDLKACMFIGKKMLLKLLLLIRQLFSSSNPKYLLNNVFIDDYCIFVQQLEDKYIREKLAELSHTKVYYEDLGFPDIDDEEEIKQDKEENSGVEQEQPTDDLEDLN